MLSSCLRWTSHCPLHFAICILHFAFPVRGSVPPSLRLSIALSPRLPSTCRSLRCELHKVGNRSHGAGRGEVTDAAVQVQTKLPGDNLVAVAKAVVLAALFDQGQIKLVVL